MDLPSVADDWAVQAFTQGLNVRSSMASQQLKQNLIEYPVVTWADVHNRYQLKIRVEEDQLGAPSGSFYPIRPIDRIKRNIDREPRLNRDRYQPYNGDRRNNGSGQNPVRSEKRNDRAAIVSAIGRIKDTKWPRPLQTDPAQRNPNQMYKYHGTHGHKMEDCRQLREEVARLFNDGHLREFLSDRAKNHFRDRDSNKQNEQEEPKHVIHIIVGGVDIPQGPVLKRTKVSIIREKRTQDYVPEGTLSFNGKDTKGIMQPHNDALVISVLMNKTRVKRMLIDLGSSANIV
ncbi:uncharacterized protein [Nicotiana tomentosiformis]|uniref:uncharacterized protein n=1 Tax=Nicotiana tomentosiformis TaxID=4098 RepID=UPI00388C99F9